MVGAGCQPVVPRDTAGIVALERELGGRVGLFAKDDGGRLLAYRADERFAMCSTFKWALAAAILAEVDAGRTTLDAAIPYGERDLLEYAPTTRAQVAAGELSVGALCEAAVTLSDNTAANLLLRTIGGPPGLTRFLRHHGDRTTRLDRDEPELNANTEGDPQDTTTPRAMVGSLGTMLSGTVLSSHSRDQLHAWLAACATCQARLRAGLPSGWSAADKTGTGPRGASGDVGVLRSPAGNAVYVATYLSGSDASVARRDRALATLGRIVADAFSD
ncbi:MAG: class A beta-lactamase [Myxococcota bacterium]